MYRDKRILALIPARGGSVGIPGKNLRPIEGKPLIAFSIEAALSSSYIDEVVVSTDSEEIAGVARSFGARVPFMRPDELARSESRTIDCVIHARDALLDMGENFDMIVLLQPTSPLRLPQDIDRAIECFEMHGEQGLDSVSPATEKPILLRFFDDDGMSLVPVMPQGSTVRRQDMKRCYRVDGCIYINRSDELTTNTSLNDNPIGFEIPGEDAVDIDTFDDLALARDLYRQRIEKTEMQ